MIHYIGVDVSKDSFDAYSKQLGGRQFSNDPIGFKLFKKWAGSPIQVVMEASGPYYLGLAHNLHQGGVVVSVINPLVIRRFCQMNLQRAKTDAKDAVSICEFAEVTQPPSWNPAPAHLQQMLQIQSIIEQLTKQLTSTLNALEALSQHPLIDTRAAQSLKQVAQVQREQISKLEKEIMNLTKEHYAAQFNSLISIPGIGNKTAVLLILSTNGFSRFKTVKQLVAYTGIAPRIYQSGKTVNKKPRISKMGMSELRRCLFLCALQAIKCNHACKDLYHRFRATGKAAKVALMAVAHKLLRQAFALVKSQKEFDLALAY